MTLRRYGSPVSAASGRVELGTPAGVLAADLQTVAANEVCLTCSVIALHISS